jgi:hypothetical protein
MVRIFSLFGLAGLFLMISPVLRGHVFNVMQSVAEVLQNNSPYSYVIAVLGVFAVFTISLNRGAQPR